MAKLIVKSPFIKSGGASGYMQYIATREGVEVVTDGQAQSQKYAEYIATRPRAERIGEHGLFGDTEHVSLEHAMAELENYDGNVWTHIISLRREDALRLGYDNAAAWRDLLRTHQNDIAAAMKIPPNDFRWYAAFHDEGNHPHVHMMAWSAKPNQAYLSKEGIRKIKSALTNDIFRSEMLHLYEQKSSSRDELVHEARRAMLALTRSMRGRVCNHPRAEQLLQELSLQLGEVGGKKSYGYLPRKVKSLVDSIVDEMEKLPVVKNCYDKWFELQSEVDDYYGGTPRKRLPLSKQKEFRQIKNAVVRAAERIRLGVVSFEDSEVYRTDEYEDFGNASINYWILRDSIRDESLPLEDRLAAVDGMKDLSAEGDCFAQYLIGKLYRDGPLLTPNAVYAKQAFTDAARQGLDVAQYALAKLCLSDDIEVRDPQLGMRWLETAARKRNQYAQYRLGKEYLRGEHTPSDVTKAVEWFTRAGEQGNAYAQYALGKLYLEGRDVPRDVESAVHWLTLSAERGNRYASFLLKRVEEDSPTPPSVVLALTHLLADIGRVFEDNSLPKSQPGGIKLDRKRLAQLREKSLAMGQKFDEQEYTGMTMQ